MKLKNKNILLISPEPWDHIFVSKHHYAAHLARRGNRVFFLGPPGNSETLEATEYENVTVVNYRGFPRGLRFFPAIVQRYFFAKAYQKLERLCLVRFDVIWSFDNSVFFDFSVLPEGVLKISHIVDLNQNFQTAKAARTADICFCTTELIKSRLLNFNPAVFKINHGFSPGTADPGIMPLPGHSVKKVLYAGNLAMPYIDWSVLWDVVRDNPETDFIFIGPDREREGKKNNAKQEISKSRNAYFIGSVSSDVLQGYYRSADVLIIAYQEKYHEDQANPHKMMEYLGSGKVIVATFTSEYQELNDLGMIVMSKSSREFLDKIGQVLANLEYWNEEAKIESRKKWALDNSYNRQLDRIEKLLNENQPK